MKNIALIIFVLLSLSLSAQNVGVGTTTPGEKLDVNGNINVTGTIKANGVDGTPNQVLMKNSTGSLAWGDMCEFKNLVRFSSLSFTTWTVPAGVTRILIEAWGGGGGASNYASGGGGGCVTALFTVAPGDNVNITNGNGGAGASGTGGAINGQATTVTINGFTINAGGGIAGGGNPAIMSVPLGGGGSVSGSFNNYSVAWGEAGKVPITQFITNGTTVYEIQNGADGGNAGNSVNTGGQGNDRTILAATPFTAVRQKTSEAGKQPGGGGGAGYFLFSSANSGVGRAGGDGMVVIHY